MITDYLRCRFSSSSLPEELIEQIIARVPCINSILRCTSVCKSWHALINSTSFINFHLSLIPYNINIPKLLLCEYDEVVSPYFTVHDGIEAFHDSCYFYRLRHNFHEADPDVVTDDSEEAAPYFAIHSDGEEFQEYYRIKSCPPHTLLQLHACNGLICYNTFDEPERLYLWNPFIGKLKTLPIPFRNFNIDPTQRSVFKLWFDSKENDYKILRINYTAKACRAKACSVEVYSLNTNSWKLITNKAPITTCFLNNNRLAYMNGTFYWPALRDDKWTLISLEIETGIFRERLTTWTAGKLYLTPSGDNDSLVILGYGDKDCPKNDTAGIICVFEVYDHSLNKLYSVDINNEYKIACHRQPLGFRNNGEVLVQNMGTDSEIVSYSVETREFKKFIPKTSRGLLRAIPFGGVTLALLNDVDAIAVRRDSRN